MSQRVNSQRVKPKKPNLNPKLSFRERLPVRRFARKYPKSIEGVRMIIADLNKRLTEINSPRKKVKAKEYDKSGAQIIKDKEIKVRFTKMNSPRYGCHQLSKALVTTLREIGIPARIIRFYPGNESKVIFRLDKQLYEATPFSGGVLKLSPEMKDTYREQINSTYKEKPKLRIRKMEKYTYQDFTNDRKK